jgi:prepilin-type processing-associated H-X9-DG protein
LIELLVVVSIIALLISILLPSLSRARNQAKATVCLTNLRSITQSMNLYANDNAGVLPPFRLKTAKPESSETYVNEWGRAKPRWQWFVADDVEPVIDPRPFIKAEGDSFGDNDSRTITNKMFLDPAMTDSYSDDIRNGAYGYNYQYLGNSRTKSNRWLNYPVRIGSVRAASGTVMVADSRGASEASHGLHSYSLDPPRMAREKDAEAFGPEAVDGVPYSPVELRHGDKGNVGFVDGHGEAMTYAKLGYKVDEKGVAQPMDGGAADAVVTGATNRLWNGLGKDKLGKIEP